MQDGLVPESQRVTTTSWCVLVVLRLKWLLALHRGWLHSGIYPNTTSLAFPSSAESFSLLSFCSDISNLMIVYLPIQPDLPAEFWTLGPTPLSGTPDSLPNP
jgi:hypothetical protein